ncbi:MAG TPA: right-handed parallel beta-helix repeat-containing protein [Actinomycetospora sp.]|nr:right-handed parallel beta-helix repeat-containing protein [Actinomycetospora sp.]
MTGRGSTRMLCAAIVATVIVGVLAACAGQTNRPSAVVANAGTLNGDRRCDSDIDGRWAWQWRQLGTTTWSSGGHSQLNCPADQRGDLAGYQWTATDQNAGRSGYQDRPPAAFNHKLTGLRANTTYQYRLLVDLKQPCDLRTPATCGDVFPVDSAGTPNGTSYDTLTTQPSCDDIQGASESLSAFASSNPAGTSTRRRVLCMRQGTQSIGQMSALKAWTTLTARGEPDGTKMPVVLNGNIAVLNRGGTLEDFRIVGCYYSSGCGTSRDKVIDVRNDDVVLRHLDITQRGGRNADSIQCVHIASDSRQLTGVRMEYSKSHSCGTESSGNHDHGLYCRDASGARIVGNWFYDNEGFGIQLYPNCDRAVAVGNVVAENGGACDVSGSTAVEYRNGFCGFSRENQYSVNNSSGENEGFFRPIHCGPTSGNKAVDMVLHDPSDSRDVTDCGSAMAMSGTLTLDPGFVNRGRYDFRMGNPYARAKLGVYAEIVPGPRW